MIMMLMAMPAVNNMSVAVATGMSSKQIRLAAERLYAYVRCRHYVETNSALSLEIGIPGIAGTPERDLAKDLQVTRERLQRRQLQHIHREKDPTSGSMVKMCVEGSRAFAASLAGKSSSSSFSAAPAAAVDGERLARRAECLTLLVWRLGGNTTAWA